MFSKFCSLTLFVTRFPDARVVLQISCKITSSDSELVLIVFVTTARVTVALVAIGIRSLDYSHRRLD